MTLRDAIHKQREKEVTRQNVIANAILMGTDVGAGLGGRALMRSTRNVDAPKIPFDRLKNLAAQHGLDVSTELTRGGGGYFIPPFLARLKGKAVGRGVAGGKHGVIGISGSSPMASAKSRIPLDIAAHEIGHGLAWSGKAGLLTKLLAQARIPSQMGAGAASLVGLVKGTLGDKPLEEREKWLNAASIGSGIGMAPVLADEALASRNALKVLQQIPGGSAIRKEVARQAVRRLARAWGTYGLGAAGMVLGPQLAKRYYRSQE